MLTFTYTKTKWDAAIEVAQATFKQLGRGSSRVTFDFDAEWVLKLPRCQGNELDNRLEAALYHMNPQQRAKCELFDFEGVVGLKMEKVDAPQFMSWYDPVTYRIGEHTPLWARELYDGPQCGWRPDRTLVVYDYAMEARRPHIWAQLNESHPDLAKHLLEHRYVHDRKEDAWYTG